MDSLKKVAVILNLIIITSCAESLDFEQVNDFVLKPVFTSALTYFTVQPFQFFDETGVQENSIEETSEIDLFQDSTIVENVVKMVFNAEFKNEFDRDVSIQVDFLNDQDLPVFSFTPIYVESEDLSPEPYEDEILLADNPDIYNAVKIRIRASLENTGTQMNPFDNTEFEFKSSITFFIESEL